MAKPMTCPTCGMTMNHHAEKLVEPRDAAEAEAAGSGMEGLIEEVHTCPGCGRETSRRGG